MILWQATIPLNPKTKKNSQRIVWNRKANRPMVLQSEEYKEYEKNCGWFLKIPDKPIDSPVNVKCVFYRENNIRCDLNNLLAAATDILTHYGVISDDNFKIIKGHDGSRVYVDKANPRTEITISNFVPDVSTGGVQC